MCESTSNDKESSGVEKCSDCGREFENLRVHHGMTDCGPDTKRQLICEYCGDDFEVHASEAERRKCCSRVCIDKLKKQRKAGENHGNTVECEYCGDVFARPPARESQHNFCGRECMTAWARENKKTGEKAKRWQGGKITLECRWCDSEFEVYPSNSDQQFCSVRCRSDWVSDTGLLSGKNNPNWGGGWEDYYGPNWDEQKEKARERDNYACQACGTPHGETKQGLHVHHIKRKEWFVENCGDEWWLEANRLENLVCLCDSCHKKWEGLPIRPKLIEND